MRNRHQLTENHAVMRTLALVCATTLLGIFFASPRPLVADATPAMRGQALFAERGCAHCHGANGVGGNIGPDLQLVRKRMNAKRIRQQVHDGSNGMPPYGDKLTDGELNDLVAFLRQKRKYVVPPKPTPAANSIGER